MRERPATHAQPTMFKHLLPLLASATLLPSATRCLAQVQVNPQFGLTSQTLQGDPDPGSYGPGSGWQAGVDMRLGWRFHLQPGLHLVHQVARIQAASEQSPGGPLIENDLRRTVLKPKVLLGFHLVNKRFLKLRINVGPTYDLLLAADNSNEAAGLDKGNLTSGSFNLDAGLGLDLWIITVEGGVSGGFSRLLEQDALNERYGDPRNLTAYATVGVVFGRGSR